MSYTKDWFSRNIPSWKEHLAKFKDREARAIELGSYEGRSAVWLMENILTHPESQLQCVDSIEQPTLRQNLAPFGHRVQFWQADATEHLFNLVRDQFDIAYIDAHHVARDVILQAGLLYPLMRRGGIMIFDDYRNSKWTVKPAVNFFIQHWKGLKVHRTDWQAVLEKTV